MRQNIKLIKRKIKQMIPIYAYKRLVFGTFVIGLVCIFLTFALVFVPATPQPYSYNDEGFMPYYSLKVDSIQRVDDYYYLIENGDYIHLYYNDEPLLLDDVKSVAGVETIVDDEVLKKILPVFQETYPELYVESIEDMTYYLSYSCLDATLAPLTSWMTLSFLFGCVILLLALFFKIIFLGYEIFLGKSIDKIVEQQKDQKLLEQLERPVHTYQSLKILMLDDFLIVNHPSPFVIENNNIAWIYVERRVFNPEYRLVIYDKNLKRHTAMYVSAFVRKNKAEIQTFLLQLAQLLPSLMIGYNKENKQKYKDMKRDCNI